MSEVLKVVSDTAGGQWGWWDRLRGTHSAAVSSDRSLPEPLEDVDPELGGLLVEHCRFASAPHGGTYVRAAAKVGRNDLCPCGSGKKSKKCCGVG
jgi:hypothetical protein